MTLPPLNALRAFEAAARLMSFKQAAEELHVTPAAISHQVKGLEEHLGLTLFIRRNRRLVLTDRGHSLLPGLTESFTELKRTVDKVVALDSSRPLNLSVTPSFAAKWLVRRLEQFRQRHPQIDVRIQATTSVTDFAQDDVDIAIRYGAGNYKGVHERVLPCGDTRPVCSPSLLHGAHPLRSPADLRHHTLLHVEYTNIESLNDWEMWLSVAKVDNVDAQAGPRFPDDHMALSAAIDGQGIALVTSLLANDDLKEGRLVQPFAVSLADRFCYYLLCRPNWRSDPKVSAFCEWFLATIETDFEH